MVEILDPTLAQDSVRASGISKTAVLRLLTGGTPLVDQQTLTARKEDSNAVCGWHSQVISIKECTTLDFSALRTLRTNLNASGINDFLLAIGGGPPRSPLLLKPGQPLSFSQQLLAALQLAARRPSGKKTVVGAKRRPREARRVGLLRKRGSAARRAGGAQRSLTAATARTSAAEPEARGRNCAYSRRPTLPPSIIRPIKQWSAAFSAVAICSLALAIAQGGCFAAPAPTADTPIVSSSTHVCQTTTARADERETAVVPDLTSAKPDRPRLRPSHVASAAEYESVQHEWDSLPLQVQFANFNPSLQQRDLLLEANAKLRQDIGSPYSNYWKKRDARSNYGSLLSIAVRGDYAGAEDLAKCGYGTFVCRDRCLCPRCCQNRLARPLLEEFGDAIGSGRQAHYLVLSFSRNPEESSRLKYQDDEGPDRGSSKGTKLASPCAPEDYGIPFETVADVEQSRLLWRLLGEAIRKFIGTGRNSRALGALVMPEIAVQLAPVRVLPHLNLIIWSHGLSLDDVRQLRRLIKGMMHNCRRLKFNLHPSISCRRLTSPDDLQKVIAYSAKPIALAAAYSRAAGLVNHEPAQMAALNAEVYLFLRHLPDAFQRVRRVERLGGCHFGSGDYFGVETPQRAARHERDAERRRALRQNGSVARRNSKQSTTPAKPKPRRSRSSRFPYWQAAVMPGPPPPPPMHSRGACPLPGHESVPPTFDAGCQQSNTKTKPAAKAAISKRQQV